MSIYLPGAYSDKSVIAAEASERVARRRYHHHQHPHHHYHQLHIAFAISTPHFAPQTRCACLQRNERTRHTEFRSACEERAREMNGHTDEEQRRKWQSRE